MGRRLTRRLPFFYRLIEIFPQSLLLGVVPQPRIVRIVLNAENPFSIDHDDRGEQHRSRRRQTQKLRYVAFLVVAHRENRSHLLDKIRDVQ